ncbi:hypothetical protein IU300_002690 [Escherichia coli]|nr:hypothetical protein [Escherichia coli]
MKLGPALAGGSFPAIQNVTGRQARRFLLFMTIFCDLPFLFFFVVTICY